MLINLDYLTTCLFLAWLRGRRKDVPSTDEVLRNVGIMQLKKVNAKKVAEENPFVHEEVNVPIAPKFPVLQEFELPEKATKK